MAISPSSFQKSEKTESEVLRIPHHIGKIKSHQDFQAMEGTAWGGEKFLMQYLEPSGRLAGYDRLQVAHAEGQPIFYSRYSNVRCECCRHSQHPSKSAQIVDSAIDWSCSVAVIRCPSITTKLCDANEAQRSLRPNKRLVIFHLSFSCLSY